MEGNSFSINDSTVFRAGCGDANSCGVIDKRKRNRNRPGKWRRKNQINRLKEKDIKQSDGDVGGEEVVSKRKATYEGTSQAAKRLEVVMNEELPKSL